MLQLWWWWWCGQVGAKTQAADRILGAHFFSPAHVMPLLEIVRTPATSKQVRRSDWPPAPAWGPHPQRAQHRLRRGGAAPAHASCCACARVRPHQALLDTLELSSKIKKTPVVVGNCTGFAVNRVFFPYTMAACMLVRCPARAARLAGRGALAPRTAAGDESLTARARWWPHRWTWASTPT